MAVRLMRGIGREVLSRTFIFSSHACFSASLLNSGIGTGEDDGWAASAFVRGKARGRCAEKR